MISNIGNVSVVSCVSVLGANKIEKNKKYIYICLGSTERNVLCSWQHEQVKGRCWG